MAQRSVKIDERNPVARFALGLACQHSRQPEKSIPEFETAIELNPNSAHNHWGLGASFLYAGDPEAAIERIRIAIDLSHQDAYSGHFIARMAEAHLLLERYEEAVEWARRALRQPGAIWPMAMLLASALGHLGRTAEGGQAVEEMLRLNPNFSERIVHEDWANPKREWQDHILDGLRMAGFRE